MVIKLSKIKRDKNGHPILNGAMLYEYDVKPKSRKPNSSNIKEQASLKLSLLMEKGMVIDKLARKDFYIEQTPQEKEAMGFYKEFSDIPKVVQFAHHNEKLKSLKIELYDLENCGNKRKIDFLKPSIQMQIKEEKEILEELQIEIRKEKIILGKYRKKCLI